MKNYLLSTLLFILIAGSAFAQNNLYQKCGTPPGASMERLARNVAAAQNMPTRSGTQYIPATVTLLANNDGSGRISEVDALANFCTLNEEFAPHGIQFYLRNGFRYLNSTSLYTNSVDNGESVPNSQKVNGTVNIFIGEIENPAGAAGCVGVLGFYDLQGDYVFMDKCTVNATSFAMAHEVGHFFSLAHTFFGWENTEYDNTQPTPTTISLGGFFTVEVEYADQSNCTTAADQMCDTPPDYGFGLGWGNCNYTPAAFDPAGNPVDPDEENIMSYFFGCAEHYFSNDQVSAMLADIAGRTFVTGSPNTAEVTGLSTLNTPANGASVGGNSVTFNWDAVPNADMYLLKVNRTPNFNPTFSVVNTIVSSTSFTSGDFTNGSNYYWCVQAFNETSACTSCSSPSSFMKTSTVDVVEIEGVSSFNIYPNPSAGQQEIGLEIQSTRTFDADISVYSMEGKVMQTFAHSFNAGFNTVSLQTTNLAQGTYVLAIRSDKGVLHKKMLIMD